MDLPRPPGPVQAWTLGCVIVTCVLWYAAGLLLDRALGIDAARFKAACAEVARQRWADLQQWRARRRRWRWSRRLNLS